MFFIIFGFIIVFLIGYQYYKDLKFEKYFEKIPQKSGLPFLGNTLQFGVTPIEFFQNAFKMWKDLGYDRVKASVGRETFVLITNPKDLEVVLSSQILLDKMNVYRYFEPGVGKGLITSSGNHWRTHRRIINPTFHFQVLNNFLDSMNENCDNLIQNLSKIADGSSFDCYNLLKFYALDIICEAAMGIKVNALNNPDNELTKSFETLFETFEQRVMSSYKRFDFLYKFTRDYRKLQKSVKIMSEFSKKVIKQRKEEYENKLKDQAFENSENFFDCRKKRAFLDTLLLATVDGEPLSDQDICDETVTLIASGHDTTASALSFCFYCLSKYPEMQQKVFEEQFQIFGSDKSRHSTSKEICEMPYLDMFIKEVLRLYPSVSVVGRVTKEPFNLNGIILPPETNIFIYIYGVGRNPKIYEDPEKFDPERFSINNRHGKFSFDYIPFSAGPRNCVGHKFAQMELKLTLSKIVRNFIVLPSTEKNYEPKLYSFVVLNSLNGIQIGLETRKYS